VNRAYHTVYDPAANVWLDAAPLPRGANHVAVAADAGRVYAMGGFIEQNRRCDDKAFAYEVAEDRWREIAPLPRPRGAAAAVILDGKVHLIGGATDPAPERASIGWHEVYDPVADTWEERAPLPTARSGHGMVVYRGRFFCMGGEGGIIERGRTLDAKVFGQMESYDPATNTWQSHAPMVTPRHAVAAVTIGEWVYVAGGGAVLGGAVQSAVHEAFTLG
jgi:N-acetylneuraminic acid mutarotase